MKAPVVHTAGAFRFPRRPPILTDETSQIVLLDTPGLLEPRYGLHRAMLHAAQQAIADADWGVIGRMRIRIAMVTGEVELRGDRYYGSPLFRAARLQALAGGGETLLAGTTVDALGGSVPDGTVLRDLGTQRLRDVSEPERVFALVHTSRARPSGAPQPEATERQGTQSVTEEEGPIRVLLVDDHAVVRRGLRGFLELIKDFDVVGEAENGREGVAAADRLAPDVILMDLLMPEMGGLEAIAAIKQAHPEIEIVAVTSFIEEEKVTTALEAGASGYLLKDAPPDELFRAIRATARGETALAPSVAATLVRRASSPGPILTEREVEILELLAEGIANREMARRLMVSEATVKSHLSHIYTKLGVDNRAGAVAKAIEQRIIRT